MLVAVGLGAVVGHVVVRQVMRPRGFGQLPPVRVGMGAGACPPGQQWVPSFYGGGGHCEQINTYPPPTPPNPPTVLSPRTPLFDPILHGPNAQKPLTIPRVSSSALATAKPAGNIFSAIARAFTNNNVLSPYKNNPGHPGVNQGASQATCPNGFILNNGKCVPLPHIIG
jgi:hypothetical protein